MNNCAFTDFIPFPAAGTEEPPLNSPYVNTPLFQSFPLNTPSLNTPLNHVELDRRLSFPNSPPLNSPACHE
jgi:hypothetical protein